MFDGFGGAIWRAPITAPALKQIWNLFLPLLIYSVLNAFNGIGHMVLASGLESRAQAAIGLGDQIMFLVLVAGTGLCTACASLVA